jgi:hypothetical protein
LQDARVSQEHRTRPRASILVWLLVAAAVAQLAFWGATNSTRLFGPFLILRIEDFASIIDGVAPFLVAAAVLLAAPHWPTGQRWLRAAAAAFATGAAVSSVTDAWWAWRMTDPVAPEGFVQVALVIATVVALLAAVIAPLLAAIGLVRGRPASLASADRPAWSGAVLAIGAVALAAGLGLLARELSMVPANSTDGGTVLAAVVYRLLVTLGGLSVVAMALAAVRAMPRTRSQPEALIAVGAIAAVIGMVANWIGQAVLSLEEQGAQFLMLFAVPWTVTAVGWVLVIAGFGAAALLVGTPGPGIERDASPRAEPARG